MIYLRLRGGKGNEGVKRVGEHEATKISKDLIPIGVDVKQFHTAGDQEAAWAIKLCAPGKARYYLMVNRNGAESSSSRERARQLLKNSNRLSRNFFFSPPFFFSRIASRSAMFAIANKSSTYNWVYIACTSDIFTRIAHWCTSTGLAFEVPINKLQISLFSLARDTSALRIYIYACICYENIYADYTVNEVEDTSYRKNFISLS